MQFEALQTVVLALDKLLWNSNLEKDGGTLRNQRTSHLCYTASSQQILTIGYL
ncbi:Protein of unknown function [Gryllus bimaculatus]|nr:Protein of unknown function [Gryllus bimaculatus]